MWQRTQAFPFLFSSKKPAIITTLIGTPWCYFNLELLSFCMIVWFQAGRLWCQYYSQRQVISLLQRREIRGIWWRKHLNTQVAKNLVGGEIIVGDMGLGELPHVIRNSCRWWDWVGLALGRFWILQESWVGAQAQEQAPWVCRHLTRRTLFGSHTVRYSLVHWFLWWTARMRHGSRPQKASSQTQPAQKSWNINRRRGGSIYELWVTVTCEHQGNKYINKIIHVKVKGS